MQSRGKSIQLLSSALPGPGQKKAIDKRIPFLFSFSIDAALPGLALSCLTLPLATTLLDRYAPSLA